MSETVLPDTLVVGGGIGGLAAALSLARRGAQVTVLERSREFVEVGAGIQLGPNAVRILSGLGVLDPLRDVAVAPRRLVLADAVDSRELTSLDLSDFPSRYGAPYLVMHRSDLLGVLLAGCRASDVRLETGATVSDLEDTGQGVRARCVDGREFAAGIAIGADGLHSTTRKMFIDDAPIHSGYVAYRGAVAMDQVSRHADLRDVVAWLGPGLHLVQYPLRSASMYNQVAVFRSDSFLRGDEDWGSPDELQSMFAQCCEHVRISMQTLNVENRWPMLDRLPLSNWTRGRVALLGDAAHPMLQYLAQGACQALEDASTLAATMSAACESGRSAAAGLAGYGAARVPQASRVQRAARLWGDVWHIDGVAKLLRDELLLRRDTDDYTHVDWLYRQSDEVSRDGEGSESDTTGDRVAHRAAVAAEPVAKEIRG